MTARAWLGGELPPSAPPFSGIPPDVGCARTSLFPVPPSEGFVEGRWCSFGGWALLVPPSGGWFAGANRGMFRSTGRGRSRRTGMKKRTSPVREDAATPLKGGPEEGLFLSPAPYRRRPACLVFRENSVPPMEISAPSPGTTRHQPSHSFIQTPHPKHQMPHSLIQTGHPKHQTPHSFIQTPHPKHQTPHSFIQTPHPKHQMPHPLIQMGHPKHQTPRFSAPPMLLLPLHSPSLSGHCGEAVPGRRGNPLPPGNANLLIGTLPLPPGPIPRRRPARRPQEADQEIGVPRRKP